MAAEEALMAKTNGGVKDVKALRAEFWRETPESPAPGNLAVFSGRDSAARTDLRQSNKGSVARVTNGKNSPIPATTNSSLASRTRASTANEQDSQPERLGLRVVARSSRPAAARRRVWFLGCFPLHSKPRSAAGCRSGRPGKRSSKTRFSRRLNCSWT